MIDPTVQRLIRLREEARERLFALRTAFHCLGLSERDVFRSLAFANIVCSLPTSEMQWLFCLQEANVRSEDRRIAEAESIRAAQKTALHFQEEMP
jgi:hypothetical protein